MAHNQGQAAGISLVMRQSSHLTADACAAQDAFISRAGGPIPVMTQLPAMTLYLCRRQDIHDLSSVWMQRCKWHAIKR